MYCFNFGLSCWHVLPSSSESCYVETAYETLLQKWGMLKSLTTSQDQNVEEEANIGQPTSLAASFSRYLQLHRRLTVQLDVKFFSLSLVQCSLNHHGWQRSRCDAPKAVEARLQ